MKKWIAMLLALCLSISLLAGCQPQEPQPTTQETTQAPTETTEATETTKPAEDLPSAEELLVYTLTQEELDKYYADLESCKTMALEGTDREGLEELSDSLDAQYEYIQKQQTIAFVNYSRDQTDEAATKLHLDATDKLTKAYDAMMLMLREVNASESPIKDVLFADWTEEELEMLGAYTSEIAQLEKENEELVVEYQALSEGELAEGIIPLYQKLVANNNRIARIYGYDNYYTYGYDVVYARDYSTDTVQKARDYAIKYLVPTVPAILQEFALGFQRLTQAEQQVVIAFMEESYQDTDKDYVNLYIDSLPQDLQAAMNHLWQYDRAIFADSTGAKEGAFTVNIGEDAICYFGPGYDGTLTLVHEMGHYASTLNLDLNACPMDLAELHSQGNEWLFMNQVREELNPNVYAVIRDYKMYMDMCTILVSFMVDDFEERIYTTDVSGYTREDFDAVAEEVCQAYGGVDFVNNFLTDFQSYWRLVVMESPVYYVSYAMSDVAALNLYTIASQDREKAYEIYGHLLKDLDMELGFQENLKKVGLSGPFDSTVYEAIAQMYGG